MSRNFKQRLVFSVVAGVIALVQFAEIARQAPNKADMLVDVASHNGGPEIMEQYLRTGVDPNAQPAWNGVVDLR